MPPTLQAVLDRAAGRADANPGTGEVLFSVTRGILDQEESAYFGDPDRPFFLASATKLYVTVLLTQLQREGIVDWDAGFARYLPDTDTSRLHVLGGIDRTGEITVRHLLQHTSGLPDYFEDERLDGSTTFGRMLDEDFGWDLDDVVRWSRQELRPRFPPGAGRHAHYSDTNYQLLGGIIEQQLGMGFGRAVAQRIAEPLGLPGTFCFDNDTVGRYLTIAPFRNGEVVVEAPLAMASFGADGGMVATLADAQRFIRSFFDGTLIPFETLAALCRDWRTVFFPIRYGTGVMRFAWPMTPPLDGHSGACGVVMYVNQASGTSIVGTLNQAKHRSAPYRVMQRLFRAVDG